MKVLFVDDGSGVLKKTEEHIKKKRDDFVIDFARSSDEALELFKKNRYDTIVSDQYMLDVGSVGLLEEIRNLEDSNVPFFICSEQVDEMLVVKALNLGADRYIMKKDDIDSMSSELAKAIDEEVEHREQAKKLVEWNSVLMSIRDINRLRNINRIFTEEDSVSSLMERSSRFLLETGDYLNVEIALDKGEDGRIEPYVNSGEHEVQHWEVTPEGQGDAPECVKEVLSEKTTVTIGEKKDYCDTCNYHQENIDHHTLLIPMISEDDIFGILIICYSPQRPLFRKEIRLLEDIAEDLSFARKKILAEKTLEEERDLFVKGPTIIFKWKPQEGYPIEYVSPNVESLLGYSQEKIMVGDIEYADLLPDCDIDRLDREVERHLDIGAERITHRPYRVIKKNGEVLWVKDYTKIVTDEDGDLKYYLGYLVDITEQKQAEEALQKSEERYRRLFESAKDGILILNSVTGEIMDANPYIREILGYSIDEMQEKKLWDIGSFENICESRDRFEEIRDQGYVRYDDIPLLTQDGEKIPVEFVSNLYRAGGEEVIQCNIRDISERKDAEKKLEEKHRLLQNLLSNAPGMAFRCLRDENYTMKFLSDGCKELTGYDPEHLIDNERLAYSELIKSDDKEKVRSKIAEASEEDQRYKVIYMIETAEGEEKWVWERGKEVKGKDGESYLEGIIMDITERKKAEDRKRFLHEILRHDVSNRFQSIKGYLKLLKDKYEDEDLIVKSKKIVENTQRMIDKIEKLREVEEQDDIYEIDVKRIIDEVLSKHEPRLKEIDIEVEAEEGDIRAKAGGLLDILFSNLLENSIRHSGCDKIRIRLLSGDDDITIIFEDDGRGIADDKKEKIFEKGFGDGKNSGTGLGMYLIQKIIDNYGGSLQVKNSKLGGARFDIQLKKP